MSLWVKSFVETSTDSLPGKTLFLYYALAQALKDQIPVVFQVSRDQPAVLFTDAGPKLLPAPILIEAIPDNALALIDAMACSPEPAGAFTAKFARCFTVISTSPQGGRYRQWAKEKMAKIRPMALWTEKEMDQARYVPSSASIHFLLDASHKAASTSIPACRPTHPTIVRGS